MNKNSLYVLVIVILLGCTVFLAYDKFNSKDNNSNSSSKILDKFVGKYVSSGYDESKLDELDTYYVLEINADGTGKYTKKSNNQSGASGKGKIAISNDTIYLLNEQCSNPVIVGNECSYPNCKPIIEFKYSDEKTITVDNNTELKKQ